MANWVQSSGYPLLTVSLSERIVTISQVNIKHHHLVIIMGDYRILFLLNVMVTYFIPIIELA